MKSKPKGFNKKLTLSKETIANLSGAEQKKALGGVAVTWYGSCTYATKPRICSEDSRCTCGPCDGPTCTTCFCSETC